jgi:glycosyltransferase involved in cell wall biosynthesis
MYKMKIVYICNEYPPTPHGGIGTFVYTIANGMKAAGHEVTVLGLGKNHYERNEAGVRVITLPLCNTFGIAWWINRNRICRWLKKEAASGNIDIVEAPEFQGPLISHPGRLPVVLRLHLSATAINEYAGKPVNFIMRFCEKKCLTLFRSWIPVSQFALDLTRRTFGVDALLSKTIYCPISPPNVEDLVPFDMPVRFVLYAGGTVSQRKGAYMLAEAAKQFLVTDSCLHLVYVGPLAIEDGTPADEKILGILGAELAGRVFFTGRISRDAVLACMKRAVVFCYPSTLETFGLVTAEAMMQGCPVVVCNTGPSPEFVDHEKTGLLVSPNTPSELAKAVNWLLENKDDADRIANAGQCLMLEKFTLEQCLEETLSFYEKCIEGQR